MLKSKAELKLMQRKNERKPTGGNQNYPPNHAGRVLHEKLSYQAHFRSIPLTFLFCFPFPENRNTHLSLVSLDQVWQIFCREVIFILSIKRCHDIVFTRFKVG